MASCTLCPLSDGGHVATSGTVTDPGSNGKNLDSAGSINSLTAVASVRVEALALAWCSR